MDKSQICRKTRQEVKEILSKSYATKNYESYKLPKNKTSRSSKYYNMSKATKTKNT